MCTTKTKYEDYILQKKCSNCSVELNQNNSFFTTIKNVNITNSSDLDACDDSSEVSNFEALSFIYAISQDQLKTKLSCYMKRVIDCNAEVEEENENIRGELEETISNLMNSGTANIQIPFCEQCAPIVSELYRIHKVLLGFSHPDSLISEFFKDFDNSFMHPDVKVEENNDCYFIDENKYVCEESEVMGVNQEEGSGYFTLEFPNDEENEDVKFNPITILQTEINYSSVFSEEGEPNFESEGAINIERNKYTKVKSSPRKGRRKLSKMDDNINSDFDDDVDYTPEKVSDSESDDNISDSEYEQPAKQKKRKTPVKAVNLQIAATPRIIKSTGATRKTHQRTILPKPSTSSSSTAENTIPPSLPLNLPMQKEGMQKPGQLPSNIVSLQPISLPVQDPLLTQEMEEHLVKKGNNTPLQRTSSISVTKRLCPVCRRIFMNEFNLRKHTLTHCTGLPEEIINVPPFQCPKCCIEYSDMLSLREHCVKVHKISLKEDRRKRIAVVEQQHNVHYADEQNESNIEIEVDLTISDDEEDTPHSPDVIHGFCKEIF